MLRSYEVEKARANWLEIQCSTLNHLNGRKFWSTYKQLFNNPSEPRLGVLLDQGSLVSDLPKKADILFRDFFSGQHLKKGAFNEKFYQDVSDQINVINMYEEGNESVTEITAYEVDKALDELNTNGKSIDPDELHPTLLKNMGPNMKDLLRTLFNRVLEDKKWPFINNEVIFIPKSGKDSYLTSSSFRPITKSSYIGKLMERILKNRITNFLRENNLEDSCQEGFMKNRSTGRYITDLVANIEECWANKSVPVALMVDLEKAFDSV